MQYICLPPAALNNAAAQTQTLRPATAAAALALYEMPPSHQKR